MRSCSFFIVLHLFFGEYNREGRDAVLACDAYRSAMQIYDALNDGKSNAVALCCVGLIYLIKFVEDFKLLVIGYFASRIADVNT